VYRTVSLNFEYSIYLAIRFLVCLFNVYFPVTTCKSNNPPPTIAYANVQILSCELSLSFEKIFGSAGIYSLTLVVIAYAELEE
jgi:hypothetical protein